jgi:hypothetical protein
MEASKINVGSVYQLKSVMTQFMGKVSKSVYGLNHKAELIMIPADESVILGLAVGKTESKAFLGCKEPSRMPDRPPEHYIKFLISVGGEPRDIWIAPQFISRKLAKGK